MKTKVIDITTGRPSIALGVNPLHFSGGRETHVNFDHDSAYYADNEYAIRIYDGSFQAVGDALIIADALRRQGVNKVHLFAPYLPAARQDRGTPFSAKVYADAINLGEFTTVVTVDPHSPVMPSLINNLVTIDIIDVLPRILVKNLDNLTIIAPDEGARTRAGTIAENWGLPLVVAEKHRDPENNFRVSKYSCPTPETEYALVVDDICDGGATFNFLADAIKIPADKLALWTTHGIYSHVSGLGELHKNYSMVASTDSFDSPVTNDFTVPVDEMMIETVHKIQ